MGNSSSKDSRSRSGTASNSQQQPLDSTIPPQSRSAEFRGVPDVYTIRASSSAAGGRGNRQDVPVFISSRRGGGGAENGSTSTTREDRPRETRQEREARRAERERQARLKERERSMREEGVDGGFLVTLGVYTGPEDFSKSIVRQLQIERRLAPFWKGLNDHSDSWAEHQLVAAVRGLPIPAPDEIPPEMARTASQTASNNPQGSDVNVNSLTIPISSRSQSYESSTSANLSASHPAFSNSSGNNTPSAAQLLRGRAKTLASLATGSKSQSPDLTPQEIRLPHDPNVNGTPIEAYLYKDASECPICFMYYPPYLNKTRCCDQPICSECFVQIKRPDPHPPEHEQPGAPPRPPEEEAETLVSEVASCPFCVTPEFGVSYDPPPFRRGLAYANQNGAAAAAGHNPLRNPTSAMSSSTSLISGGSGSGAGGGGGGRRRATSLSANAPQVITTDRVRPEWAKKLADARANALRRSAAATALHNAAYVLGGQGGSGEDGGGRGSGSGALAGFRRRGRRALLVDSPGSGSATPGGAGGGEGDDGANSSSDLYPERGSSARARVARSRVEDIEELMMMEAIRLSLAAEEERKRKEEKDLRKEAKKRDKEAKKEAKREAEAVEKAAKKNNGSISSLAGIGSSKGASGSGSGLLPPPSPRAPSAAAGSSTGLYQAGPNDSTSTTASVVSDGTPGAGSASNLASPVLPQGQSQQGIIPEEGSSQSGAAVSQNHQSNKGKEPAQDFAGFNPLNEPTSTLNTEMKTKKEEDNEASPPSSAAATGGVSGGGEHNESHNSLDTPTAANIEDPQQHLEASRANLQPVAAAAVASGEADRGTGEHTPNEITPNEGEEPLLNYASLAKSMGLADSEGGGGNAAEKDGHEAEHHEGVVPSTAKMVDGDDATTAAAGSTGLAGKDD